MKPIELSIADQAKNAREQARLTVQQAAKLSGVRQPTINNIESGRTKGNAVTLIRLSKVYRYTFAIDARAYNDT